MRIPAKALKIGGIVLGALALTTAASAAYLNRKGAPASVTLGGKSVSVTYNGGFRATFKNADVGCCWPHCEEMSSLECATQWQKGGCGLIPDCDVGCCTPLCQDVPRIQCGGEYGYPGDWHPQKCDKLDECKEGCCQVDCLIRRLSQDSCEHINGFWTADCETGCCKSESGQHYLPQLTCEECTGGKWYPDECPTGFSVHLYAEGSVTKSNQELFFMLEGTTTADYELTVDAYTCEDTVLSTWKGTVTTTTTITTVVPGLDTETDSETLTDNITLMFSESGQLEYGIEGLFTAYITETEMTLKWTFPIIGEVELKGSVTEGATECEANE